MERHHQQNVPSESQSPPPYASNPSSPGTGAGIGTVESSPDSGPSLGIPRSLARNMNAEQDTSVTYRYYVIEEQERARARARALDAADSTHRQGGESVPSTANPPETAPQSTGQATARIGEAEGSSKPPTKDADNTEPVVASQKTPDKKSRKVTFDVNPDVVTIKREINAEKEGPASSVPEDGKHNNNA